MLFFLSDNQVRKNIFSNVQHDATTTDVAMLPSITKWPTGKLLSIFVSETIKTSILPLT